jgi:Flp pilus assembly protein TadD
MARARYLSGDVSGTREMTASIREMTAGRAPLLEAETRSLEGLAYAQEGLLDEAGRSYQQAILLLSGIGADKGAAQLWFDLADHLDKIGMTEEARDAYRRAAASTGLRATVGSPIRSLV